MQLINLSQINFLTMSAMIYWRAFTEGWSVLVKTPEDRERQASKRYTLVYLCRVSQPGLWTPLSLVHWLDVGCALHRQGWA